MLRFRLTTLLAVVTAIALCLGANFGALRELGLSKSDAPGALSNLIVIFSRLPVYLVCVVGAALVFERRDQNRQARILVLSALSVKIAWICISAWAQPHILRSSLSRNMFTLYITAQSTVSSLIEATCWTLMIAAFISVSRRASHGNPLVE